MAKLRRTPPTPPVEVSDDDADADERACYAAHQLACCDILSPLTDDLERIKLYQLARRWHAEHGIPALDYHSRRARARARAESLGVSVPPYLT